MLDAADPTAGEDALLADIRARIRRLPEIAEWGDMQRLLDLSVASSRPCWELGLDSCEALGGERRSAWPTAAVVFCLLQAIHLVDDLLDEDPSGMQHRLGIGPVANAALGFQSAANLLVARLGLDSRAEAAAQRRLGQICLGTAFGQMLDGRDEPGEEAYWRMVELKTPPLFSYGLYLGALVAGVDLERADRVAGLGRSLGHIVQICDDLRDALEEPAAPDWQRRSTNLPILYALTAEHGEREDFVELKPRVAEDEGALRQAQEILVRSGAVSYCAYRLIGTYRDAVRQIDALDLPEPKAMHELFDHHVAPLKQLLRSVGVRAPETLFEAADG